MQKRRTSEQIIAPHLERRERKRRERWEWIKTNSPVLAHLLTQLRDKGMSPRLDFLTDKSKGENI